MDYKQLEEVNAKLSSIDIKGKSYIEVNQRIKAFRMLEPNGSIETELLSIDNGTCIIKAVVKNADGKILGTGHAYEKEGSTFINKTSYIENAETSAIGRALGMLGIGIDTSIASAEEVANAIKQQEQKLDENLLFKAAQLNIDLDNVAIYLKKSKNQLTNQDLKNCIAKKEKQLEKHKEVENV